MEKSKIDKMNFRTLDQLLREIRGKLMFDTYKPLRQQFRDFADYLKSHPQQNTNRPDFWDGEVPENIITKFQKLYDTYLSLNPGDSRTNIDSHNPINSND